MTKTQQLKVSRKIKEILYFGFLHALIYSLMRSFTDDQNNNFMTNDYHVNWQSQI